MNKLAGGIIPMYNRLLVKRVIKPKTSDKGIIMSTTDKKQGTYVATVMEIGSHAFK